MTTGERLVAISTLTSDTAMNHFLNINTGGETIYIGKSLDIEIKQESFDLASCTKQMEIATPAEEINLTKTTRQLVLEDDEQDINIK